MKNYLKLINEIIEKFTNQVPEEGYELNYLNDATVLYDLYAKASIAAEEDDEVALKELYETAQKFIK